MKNVTNTANPGGSPVAIRIVIGGAQITTLTDALLVHPAQPQQQVQLVAQNANSNIQGPINIPPGNLPGWAVGCQIAITALAPNQPWHVAMMAAQQGGALLPYASDGGIIAAAGGVAISTLWITFT